MTEIKHKITGSVLWRDDKPTLQESLEAAIFARANLDGTNLAGAYLAGAYLARANLDGANLAGANLADANLAGAYLDGTNLAGANLDGTNLAGANLAGANLAGANLDGANLAGANLDGANAEKLAWKFAIYPQRGAFLAFKKVATGTALREHAVLLVEIPADAPRVNALSSRKGRASRVIVRELISGPIADYYVSKTDTEESRAVRYVVGEETAAHEWCDDVRVECAAGIHFFLTREEAEAW